MTSFILTSFPWGGIRR